jgi:hypothetical protein
MKEAATGIRAAQANNNTRAVPCLLDPGKSLFGD